MKGLFETFSTTSLSVTTLCHCAECRILLIVMPNVIMLSVEFYYAGCHYTECYAECCYAECRGATECTSEKAYKLKFSS
jgi:hypothetical protein